MSNIAKRLTVEDVERRALRMVELPQLVMHGTNGTMAINTHDITTDIQQLALALAAQNDEEGAKEFLASLRDPSDATQNNINPNVKACLRTWFLDDQARFVHKVAKPEEFADYIRYRAYQDVEHIVAHCPKLFLYFSHAQLWGVPKCLGLLNKHCSREQKEEALLGEGSHKVLADVIKRIGTQKDPRVWIHLDHEWIGEPGSRVRDKAIELGWNAKLYLEHLAKNGMFLDKLASWWHATPYPYSLFVLQMYLNKDTYGTAFERTFEKLEEDPNANPIDAVLACILQTKAPQYTPYWPSWKIDYPFEPHPKVQAISTEQKQYLTGLVDVHMALGSLQTLVDMLVNGELTQMLGMHSTESFDFPDFGGP